MKEPPTNICPLMSIGDETDYQPCIEGRCAWWAEDRCSVADIAVSLCNLDRGGIIVNES